MRSFYPDKFLTPMLPENFNWNLFCQFWFFIKKIPRSVKNAVFNSYPFLEIKNFDFAEIVIKRCYLSFLENIYGEYSKSILLSFPQTILGKKVSKNRHNTQSILELCTYRGWKNIWSFQTFYLQKIFFNMEISKFYYK